MIKHSIDKKDMNRVLSVLLGILIISVAKEILSEMKKAVATRLYLK